MHCRACDALLSDFEATRRNAITFDFLDLCNACYSEIRNIVPAIERKDLMTSEDYDDFFNEEGDNDDLKDYLDEDLYE